MGIIYISVVVASQSHTLENTLLQFDLPLDPEQAGIYRSELEKWLKTFPLPGDPKFEELPTDQATLLAIQLPQILGSRDPALFSPYYLDFEGDAAMIERRPYDWARLEAV